MAGNMMSAAIARRLETRPIGARQIWIVMLVQFILMIDGLDIQLLGLVTPVVLQEWQVERAAFGPALAASLFGLSLGAGAGGWLGDRFGRKRVLTISAFLFGLATIGAAFANSIPQMTAIRFVSGLGFGAAAPSSIALVAEWLPRRAQAKAVAFLSVGTPFGGMVGSLALQLLLPMLGWRGCFVLCGLLTLAVALLVLLALPESAAYLAGRGETARAAKLARRVAGVTDLDAPDPAPAGAVSVDPPAAPGESMFARHYRRLTLGGWLLFFSAQFIAYSFISWSPTFLTMAKFPLDQALQASFSFNLFAMMAALVTGLLIHRHGSRRVALGASALTAASLALLTVTLLGAVAPPGPLVYWTVMASVAGVGIFVSTAIATGYALLALGYSEQVRSTGIGIGLMVGRTGGVVTGLTGGVLLSMAGDQSWPYFTVLLVLTVAICVGALLIDRHIAAD